MLAVAVRGVCLYGRLINVCDSQSVQAVVACLCCDVKSAVVDAHAFHNSMIHRRVSCGAAPPRLSEASPLVELSATRPTRTLAPLLHETTSVTGPEDGSERISVRQFQGPAQSYWHIPIDALVFAAGLRPSWSEACVRWTEL